jgi:hypothetical protein
MILTTLQPLLLLAAIAIVGGVPLLGAVSSATPVSVAPAAADGVRADADGSHRVSLVRIPAQRRVLAVAGSVRRAQWQFHTTAARLTWSVRSGASELPPPRA